MWSKITGRNKKNVPTPESKNSDPIRNSTPIDAITQRDMDEIETAAGFSTIPSIQALRETGAEPLQLYSFNIPSLDEMLKDGLTIRPKWTATMQKPTIQSPNNSKEKENNKDNKDNPGNANTTETLIYSTCKDQPMSLDQFDRLSMGKRKIWVVGTYKVGKSTLLNLLMGRVIFKADEVENTRGEEILICGDNIFVDTEGFNQPLDVIEPYVKRDFLMSHLMEWCDVLVIVVDRLTIPELQLFTELSEAFTTNKNIQQLLVLHNVKTVKSLEGLSKHVQHMTINLEDTLQHKILANTKTALGFSQFLNARTAVHHHFIGEMFYHSALWRESFNQFVCQITSCNKSLHYFSKSIRAATMNVLHKYYESDRLSVRIRDSQLVAEMTNPRRLMLGDELNLRGRSRLSATFCCNANSKRLYIIISMPEFYLVDFNLISSDSVHVKGFIRELHRKHMDGICSEIVHLPCKIITVKLKEDGDSEEWAWRRLGISSYGSTLIEVRCADSLVNLEKLPSLSQEIFHTFKPDPLWIEITERHVRASQSRKNDVQVETQEKQPLSSQEVPEIASPTSTSAISQSSTDDTEISTTE